MRSRGDLDLGAPVHRRNLDRTAQQGRRHGDVQVVDQIVAVTHQFGVALLLDHHLQVAVHAALTRGVALARDGEDHTLAHAGRNLDLHDLLPAQRAFALALVARRGDHLARAAARGAHALRLHPAEEGVLHPRHIARAVAGRTGRIGIGVPGSRAAALVAGDGLVDLEFLRNSVGDLGQRQTDPHADVRAAVHAPSPAAVRRAESAPEMAAENVAELREDVLHREPSAAEAAEAAGPAACRAAHSGMAELVVTGALVGVRQHVVGLCGLLEFLLGLLVPGVFVGVELDGRFAVGLLYFVCVSVLRNAQHFVVIPFFCHGLTLLQLLLRSAAPSRPACNPSERRR